MSVLNSKKAALPEHHLMAASVLLNKVSLNKGNQIQGNELNVHKALRELLLVYSPGTILELIENFQLVFL